MVPAILHAVGLLVGINNMFCLQYGTWGNTDATGIITFPITFTKVFSFCSRLATSKSEATVDKYFGYDITTSGFYRPKGVTNAPGYYIVIGTKI